MNDLNKNDTYDTDLGNRIYECLTNVGFRGLDGQALVMHIQQFHYDSPTIRRALYLMTEEGRIVWVPSGRYKTKESIPQ